MAGAANATIRDCPTIANSLEPGAFFVTNAIKRGTRPDDFDMILGRPNAEGYQLNFGGRCGWTALMLH